MKSIIALAVASLIVAASASALHVIEHKNLLKSDSYIRDRVLMLTGRGVQCSAIQVITPKKKVVTLSAAHCADMAVNDYILATAEDGSQKLIKVLLVDVAHDLMVLEPYDEKSIEVAKSDKQYEHVHTLTHGHGKHTYRTDGALIGGQNVVVADPIQDDEAMSKCKNVVVTPFGIVCEKKLYVEESTAQVIPGSSGGAVLNESGQLVGIVSCTDGFFAGFVPLSDIQTILKAF